MRFIAEDANFKNKFGLLLSSYSKITFDKEVTFRNSEVEFVSFGHLLFEALLEWVVRKFTESMHKDLVFKDPEGRLNGVV